MMWIWTVSALSHVEDLIAGFLGIFQVQLFMQTNTLSKHLALLMTMLITACGGSNTRPLVQEQSVKKTLPTTHLPSAKSPQVMQPSTNNSDVKIVPTTPIATPITTPVTPKQPHTSKATQPIIQPENTTNLTPTTPLAALTSKPDTPMIQNQNVTPPIISAPSSQNLPQSKQSAIEPLLNQADAARARGDIRLAVIKLQQSQRIAPNEPKVYARLAALYLAENNPTRSEQMARKGLTLVGNNPTYLHYFWRLIAACKQRLGDREGQHQATQQANRYKNS